MKRSVLRVIGLLIITSGIYLFYWFFVTKNQLKRELKNDQHVGWQTVGLIVPILSGILSAIFFDESFGLLKVAGAALVFAGLLLLRVRPKS